MNINELLTIVIPCKNEENYILRLLDSLRMQKLSGARIIIADCSTDNTRKLITDHSQFLNIEVIQGGAVAWARNQAANLATTPYIFFIDADVIFFNPYVIRDAVHEMHWNHLDLITCNIKCYEHDWKASLAFTIFNQINHCLKHFSPFAIGACMLVRKSKFDQFGGFNEQFVTSEDYFLSRMFDTKKFKILNHDFGQDSRRFKKMGYIGMACYLVRNFLNRNNIKYWQSQQHNRYWT